MESTITTHTNNINNDMIEKKFNNIIEIISQKANQRNKLNSIFKICKYTKTLLIHLKYKKETEFNSYPFNLLFTIVIDKEFPLIPPEVFSTTNFCYPTLYDQRNLLESVLGHVWYNYTQSEFDNSISSNHTEEIEELISAFPKFISRAKENEKHKVMIYFGNYDIKKYYDMNEFLVNPNNRLYRVNQHTSKPDPQPKYLIVTDIYILLFRIRESYQSYGKLQFWGGIKELTNIKKKKEKINKQSEDILQLEWEDKTNNKRVSFKFSFKNKNKDDFNRILQERKSTLLSKCNMFLEDLAKPISYQELILNKSKYDATQCLTAIQFFENLRKEDKFSIYAAKELILLYQKIIEDYNANNNMDFLDYKKKLTDIMNDPLLKDDLDKNLLNDWSPSPFE